MKINLFTIAVAYLLITLTSCGKDNYDIYAEDENHTPTTIVVVQGLQMGIDYRL